MTSTRVPSQRGEGIGNLFERTTDESLVTLTTAAMDCSNAVVRQQESLKPEVWRWVDGRGDSPLRLER